MSTLLRTDTTTRYIPFTPWEWEVLFHDGTVLGDATHAEERVITERFAMLSTYNGRSRPRTNWGKVVVKSRPKRDSKETGVRGEIGGWSKAEQIMINPINSGLVVAAATSGPLAALTCGQKHLATTIQRTHPLRREWKFGTTLVESKDLPRLRNQLTAGAFALASAFRRAKRGDFGGFRDALSESNLASGALGYTFGVAPTVNDVANFLSSADNASKRWRNLKKGKGLSGRSEFTSSSGDKSVTAGVHVSYENPWARPPASLPDVPFTKEDFLRRVRGLDLKPHDLLRAGYDFTPWSWLADWFTNAGAILDASTLVHEVQVTSVCYTCTETWKTGQTVQGLSKPVELTSQWERKARWCGPYSLRFAVSPSDFSLYHGVVASTLLRTRTR